MKNRDKYTVDLPLEDGRTFRVDLTLERLEDRLRVSLSGMFSGGMEAEAYYMRDVLL